MIQMRLLFSQINTISPTIHSIKQNSVANDFAFVSRMFSRAGNDVKVGIENAIKSDYKK